MVKSLSMASSLPPSSVPVKRPRESSPDPTLMDEKLPTAAMGAEATPASTSALPLARSHHASKPSQSSVTANNTSASSNFRNVSACNRCRLRKNRCDQRLPSCASCAKASVACVGYDPITKMEIPRSYVYYLETRVEGLEALLRQHDIEVPAADNLDMCSRIGYGPKNMRSAVTPTPRTVGGLMATTATDTADVDTATTSALSKSPSTNQTGGMPNIMSASKPKSLASTSGVSFARVVFAAVQHSVSDGPGGAVQATTSSSMATPVNDTVRDMGHNATSMRDSFFGLHTKPSIRPAPFPPKAVASHLVNLYFEHANPQIPILHRVDFMNTFEQAYAPGHICGPRELYLLNMVFAIGGSVIVGEPVKLQTQGQQLSGGSPLPSSLTNSGGQAQPEEYHASAIVHLEACLGNSTGSLDVLQAVLLLANFALLRPVPPGLWYIVGVAVRLAVDLGLHYEDGTDIDSQTTDGSPDKASPAPASDTSCGDRGKRMYIRDMRRRLWWCTYSLDRLVSTCVGRPFGISDLLITTEFPSYLDDVYITPEGFREPQDASPKPSYKHVSIHYLKLRLLQSEILQVLQFNQTRVARENGQNMHNSAIQSQLVSPFLARFDSFRSWRIDIDRRLYQWRASAPTRDTTGVAFSTEFLELNYWQAIILLYRQSLSVPALFEGEYNPSREVDSPSNFRAESVEDEDRVYLKVAEAGQKILRIYRQLHLDSLVSYTYLSTHHLFMAGVSYLYAIWHSPIVRSRLTMEEVDFTVLAAKSVFTDMIDKCPPAETCRDAFARTAKATIKMVNSQGGFGTPVAKRVRRSRATRDWHSAMGEDTDPLKSLHSHSHGRSQDQPVNTAGFHFDMSMSDALSSPSLSTGGELADASPQQQFRHSRTAGTGGFDVDSMNSIMGSASGASPQDQPAPEAPLMSAGSNVAINACQPVPPAFMSPQQQQQQMSQTMDYSNALDMDFLSSLAASGADLTQIDRPPVDLGFGLNWDGVYHDFTNNQQVNLFDNFFFGSQNSGAT
ncbi:Positive regulator of purine utilization [Ceratocystis fimbriata CBS 114723]|uniref:Positive regulator of purine utilization n=1 Tax=Ceratocystis fimbriata CBS 114723 TaxID=1035309 RepID=A0A2C5X571_9PEZI|nr:Positive regulator of purine utilization [Ceratocystis fimbriata CBS 114723]